MYAIISYCMLFQIPSNPYKALWLYSCICDGDALQEHAALIQQILLRLAARYLYSERRRSQALDPVANFHLRNGAGMWRLCPMADPSPNGMQRSFGVMVNYKYILADVAANNHAYVVDGQIPASPLIIRLATGVQQP